METSILNEFLVLAETNSFSKAAKELGTSQASLSRHILQLEKEYGVTFFERTTQKMKLTPYGDQLVIYSRNILENESALKRTMERMKFKNSNHLVVGTVDFPFYYGITALLASFKKEYPNATLEVKIESTDSLVQMLSVGEVDVAFLRNICGSVHGFDGFLFAEDYVRISVPKDHRLAGRSAAVISDFEEDTFYRRYRRDSLMDQFVMQIFKEAGFEPKITANEGIWGDSVINDPHAVTTCMGALAENFRGNVHLSVLDLEPKRHADVWLITKKTEKRSDLVNAFMSFSKDSLPIR